MILNLKNKKQTEDKLIQKVKNQKALLIGSATKLKARDSDWNIERSWAPGTKD